MTRRRVLMGLMIVLVALVVFDRAPAGEGDGSSLRAVLRAEGEP